MFGIDPDRAPYKKGRPVLFEGTFNSRYYKVKGTFADSRLKRIDVWRRRDFNANDHLRRELFKKGDKDSRFRLKPGYRDYEHYIYARHITKPADLWKNGANGRELRTFGGLKGGMVHGVEGRRLSNNAVRRALKGLRKPGYWRGRT